MREPSDDQGPAGALRFGEFLLADELRHRGEPVLISPKALLLLRLLTSRAGSLVTKQAIWDAVWPKVVVSDAALTVCVAELRSALGDDAKKPSFIATVSRRGYRFIASIESSFLSEKSELIHRHASAAVGRSLELQQLHGALTEAKAGKRQIIFIAGESGIGKTTLLELFTHFVERDHRAMVMWGQCASNFGPSEPYLPLLDALGRTCHRSTGEALVTCLARHAPQWLGLLNMPSPSMIDSTSIPRPQVPSPERMMRELSDAIEVLSNRTTVVVCLEDLHWADNSTLDWLNFIARRHTKAKLLIAATFRDPPDLPHKHSLRALRHELGVLPWSREIVLEPFGLHEITEIVSRNFPADQKHPNFPDQVAEIVNALSVRTGGHPLFITHLVNDLVSRRLLGRVDGQAEIAPSALNTLGLPVALKKWILLQVDNLAKWEIDVLEAASVAGDNFSTEVIAAALLMSGHHAEQACESLARRSRLIFVSGRVEWPDGTVASRYVFKHSLYRELLYERIAPGRAARLHRLVGNRLEIAFSIPINEVAGEIAMHYERGHSSLAAAKYYMVAGQNALSRAAGEAIEYFQRSLSLLKKTRRSHEVDVAEFTVLTNLGPLLMTHSGWASAEVEAIYERANKLASIVENPASALPAITGMWMTNMMRGNYELADKISHQLFHLARSSKNSDVLLQAHHARWPILLFRGKFDSVNQDVSAGLDLYSQNQHRHHAFLHMGHDPAVCAHACALHANWALGSLEKAALHGAAAIDLARKSAHPPTLAFALAYEALSYAAASDVQFVQHATGELLSLSREHKLAPFEAVAQILEGWAISSTNPSGEGVELMRYGLKKWEALGNRTWLTMLLCLYAESLLLLGRSRDASESLDRALRLTTETDERWWESRIYDLRAQTALQVGDRESAAGILTIAVQIAQEQNAKSWELRSTLNLARLWSEEGELMRSVEILKPVYESFRDSLDTPQLIDARAFLEVLG